MASAVKANLEKVIALKADLVLVTALTDLQDIETLRKFGIKVEVFQSPKSFKEICSQFIRLGILIGKEEKARRIVLESEQKIKEISSGVKWKKKPRMFFQIGADPLFSVLPNTFMDDYINFFGAENIAKTLKRGSVSREFVIANNPDYIFIVTMGMVGNEEKEIWSRYSNLTASRKKQIHIIESDIACQPTPVTFVQTMEILKKMINE
ncbi:Vitamin B12-binding protein [bioreactor metagenome]|uniref:Vitamin B12-binding protein n=1 Tax=bioreactor metagenome TaxID=1076179 RepID=A0A645DJX9_9ZZZZ